MLAKKLGTDPQKLQNRLWGDNFWDAEVLPSFLPSSLSLVYAFFETKILDQEMVHYAVFTLRQEA